MIYVTQLFIDALISTTLDAHACMTNYIQFVSVTSLVLVSVLYGHQPFVNRSSIGRVFRPLLRRRRKMAALPLPAAILDDLIPSFRFREWGHPRWRPEPEGPPSCASASIGVEKRAPSLGWRHFRRRHHGSKMATAEMTSGGRRDAHEDVLQTSAPSMSPVEVWLYFLVRLKKIKSIWSLASPRHYPSDWVSCPLATTRKWSVCTCRKLWKTFDFSKHLLYFFFFDFIFWIFFFNCTLQ